MTMDGMGKVNNGRKYLNVMAYGSLAVLFLCLVFLATGASTPNWVVFKALAIGLWGSLGLIATDNDPLEKFK